MKNATKRLTTITAVTDRITATESDVLFRILKMTSLH
jgi:hypothetical protein